MTHTFKAGDIKRLREVAEAANCAIGDWYTSEWLAVCMEDGDDGDFIEAMSPTTALALIERIERLEGALRWIEDWRWAENSIADAKNVARQALKGDAP